MKKSNGYLSLLGKYLKPQWRQVLLLAILFFFGIGLQLVIPQILKFFIDYAREGRALETLLKAGGLFMALSFLQQLVEVVVTYFSQNIGWKSTNALREDLVSHCLGLNMGFHKNHLTGELIERIDGDVTAMFNFFSNLLVELLSHIFLMLGVLILLYRENGYIGLVMTFFVVFAVFVLKKLQRMAVPRHIELREKKTNYYAFLGEALGNIEDIRANGGVVKINNKLKGLFREWVPANVKASIASMSMYTSKVFIFAIGNALAFGIGGILWSKGIITVGTVYLIFHYTEMLSAPLREIQRQLTDLQKSGASIERVENLLKTQSAIVEGMGSELPKGALALEINKIHFSYEDGVVVVDDLSLKLEAGKVLGVLGRTGSGKTTLARLLTRFYDISQGEICISGHRINSIPMKNLRNQVAYVTQEVQLFNATVRDNLTFFNTNITDERIWNALDDMGLKQWIDSLPQGLDTILASDGGGLSAGEAQLLAFVRVFLKDPGMVILDEASSKLDPITENLMEGAIDKLLEGRTGMIIAHRLQTVERADEILILEEGKMKEYGDRVALMEDEESQLNKLLQTGIKEVLA
ncbi:ABC transporter ATP-binding protein [Alkaliphilus hydrothermalis]|uniref:ATP-binding cassette subfamily B protein n=1 Tax=Alkaliphilus hydrothermalis TaxID=1482730 RepID=A0ABS2NT40_9FIRM|nr:ABC transporter ATP-binding protein [Alkaliphilus hydrothermalis]MBM7616096.1 ATP-binding cassette subfamily B protein [Alkaliphilus hydrothermalis]